MKIGCVVMAAGNSVRFGRNKLLAQYEGRPLIQLALQAVPAELFSRVAVVTQYPEVESLARSFRFQVVSNPHPEAGQSLSVRLGLARMLDCDAVLFQVADQPHLRRSDVEGLLAFYESHPDHIVALGHQGRRGNPCLFPARFFPELLEIEGDQGGSSVIRAHESDLLLWEVPTAALMDVDTPQQLHRL